MPKAHGFALSGLPGSLDDVVGWSARPPAEPGAARPSHEPAGRPSSLRSTCPETLSGMELLEMFRRDNHDMVRGRRRIRRGAGAITLQRPAGSHHRRVLHRIGRRRLGGRARDGSWLMDGLIPVARARKTGLDLKKSCRGRPGRYNTLAGMIMLLLGRLPRTDSVEWLGWRSRSSTWMANVSTRSWSPRCRGAES